MRHQSGRAVSSGRCPRVGLPSRTALSAGYTLLELMVVVGILAVLMSLAGMAGAKWVVHGRLSLISARLADEVTLAHERAISKYERWRITFDNDGAGLSHRYMIEHCPVAPTGLADTCAVAENWQPYVDPRLPRSGAGLEGTGLGLAVGADGSVELKPGFGLVVRDASTGQAVSILEFGPDGYFLDPEVELVTCQAPAGAIGATSCQPGGRVLHIRHFSGTVEG